METIVLSTFEQLYPQMSLGKMRFFTISTGLSTGFEGKAVQ
jgi:hypothetical protein